MCQGCHHFVGMVRYETAAAANTVLWRIWLFCPTSQKIQELCILLACTLPMTSIIYTCHGSQHSYRVITLFIRAQLCYSYTKMCEFKTELALLIEARNFKIYWCFYISFELHKALKNGCFRTKQCLVQKARNTVDCNPIAHFHNAYILSRFFKFQVARF